METSPLYAHDRYPAGASPSLGYAPYSEYAGEYHSVMLFLPLYMRSRRALPCSNNTLAPSSKKPGVPTTRRPAHFYIPPVLRLPSLLIVFLISVALIGVVEYGLQKLPHAQKHTYTDPMVAIQSLLHKRQTSTVGLSTIPNQYVTTGTTIPNQYVTTSTTIPNQYVTTTTPSRTPNGTTTSIAFPLLSLLRAQVQTNMPLLSFRPNLFLRPPNMSQLPLRAQLLQLATVQPLTRPKQDPLHQIVMSRVHLHLKLMSQQQLLH